MPNCIAVENYGHPATHPPSIIVQDATNRFVTDAEKAIWNVHDHARLMNSAKTLTGVTVNADGSITLIGGTNINEFSTDATLSGNSADAVPTENAVKGYVDGEVATIDAAVIVERAARVAAELVIQQDVDANQTASEAADGVLTTAISDETAARIADVGVEEAARIAADAAERALYQAADAQLAIDYAAGDAAERVLYQAADAVFTGKFAAGLTETLTFGGGVSGNVATLTLVDGLITAKTLVP